MPGRRVSLSDGREVTAKSGRYGPYVTDGENTASLFKSMSLDTITQDEALRLLTLPRTLGALDGEEVIIAKRDKPLVRLEALRAAGLPGRRPLGWAAGTGFYMAEDFDAPLEDFDEYMYSDAELARRRVKKKRK